MYTNLNLESSLELNPGEKSEAEARLLSTSRLTHRDWYSKV
jgi:hypothetical protein